MAGMDHHIWYINDAHIDQKTKPHTDREMLLIMTLNQTNGIGITLEWFRHIYAISHQFWNRNRRVTLPTTNIKEIFFLLFTFIDGLCSFCTRGWYVEQFWFYFIFQTVKEIKRWRRQNWPGTEKHVLVICTPSLSRGRWQEAHELFGEGFLVSHIWMAASKQLLVLQIQK